MTKADAPEKKPEVVSNVRKVRERPVERATKIDKRKLVDAPAMALEELKKIKAWYKKNANDTVTITCLNCNSVIAIEAQMPNRIERTHVDGYTVVPVDGKLMSYRIRLDGSMGYSCICGNSNILLPEENNLRGQFSVAPHVEDQIKREIKQNKSKRKHGEVPENTAQFKRERVK